MWKLFLLILITNLYSCSEGEEKSIEKPNMFESSKEHQTLGIVSNFLNSMNSATTLDDSREFFYEFYYEPNEIIDGELINYFIRDFEMIWEDVKDATPPFVNEKYEVLQGKSLLESPYGLMLSKNTTCDDCVVLIPKHRKEWRYEICIKDQKIYSTIGTYDLDKEEYIWYRDKKHPPMRFK